MNYNKNNNNKDINYLINKLLTAKKIIYKIIPYKINKNQAI